jgi:hypothetical protein
MTIVTEGKNSFFISTPVKLLDLDHDTAADWASQHIIANPAIRWIVGKYVEADNANSNGQQWSLEDLRQSQSSIRHTPMNLAHKSRNIVGTFVASEMIYPDYADANPYIETLGAFWKYYFPEELAMVETAYQMDALYQSMECISESVTCAGPNGCGQTFDYAGPMSESYCEHILSRESSRQLNKPLFLAGALIYPPERPGWKNASVNELSQISSLISDEAKHDLIKSIAQESPTLSPKEWEFMMFRILEQTFSDASQENDISRSLDDLNLVPTDGRNKKR